MKKNKGSASDYRRQDGFTLIELLVVIAIIGILATVTIAILSGAKNKGIDAKVKAQLKSMDSQALLFTGSSSPFITNSPQIAGIITPDVSNNNLFLSNTNTSSLYNLLNKLPAGTPLYFGWDGVRPEIGGKWFVAAGTKTGAIGIDFTGKVKSWKGDTPTSTADFTAIFPDANQTSYSCQRVNDNPVTPPPSNPQCSDGKDNDKDGFTDVGDSSCYEGGTFLGKYLPDFDDESYISSSGPKCSDGIDNDNDKLVDSADPECHIGGNLKDKYREDWDSEVVFPQ